MMVIAVSVAAIIRGAWFPWDTRRIGIPADFPAIPAEAVLPRLNHAPKRMPDSVHGLGQVVKVLQRFRSIFQRFCGMSRIRVQNAEDGQSGKPFYKHGKLLVRLHGTESAGQQHTPKRAGGKQGGKESCFINKNTMIASKGKGTCGNFAA